MNVVVLVLVLVSVFPASSGNQASAKSALTQSEIKALVQAVQDDIYDYGDEGYFFPVGGTLGDAVSESRTRMPLYIDPVVEDGEGRVIYKRMPQGEVLRLFHVRADGAVVLDGDPELGFPATQPSEKTVYLKDDDVARMKRDWIKSSFEVVLSPSPETVRDAARRQKQRTGNSHWEAARSVKKRRSN